MKRSYPVWLLLTLGMFVVAIVFAGGKLSTYVYLPSLLVVVCPPSFLTIAVFGLSTYGRSFRVAFQGVSATKQELKVGAELFAALQRYLLLTGLITSMIGFIAILGDLGGAQEPSRVGLVISLALSTLFYSLILIFAVAVPFRSALEKRLIGNQTSDSVVGTSG